MSQEQMDSIMEANLYVVRCKFGTNCSKSNYFARKYLNIKIGNLLTKKVKKEKLPYVSIFSFIFPFFN